MKGNLKLIYGLLAVSITLTIVLVIWGKTIACYLHPEVFKPLSALVITSGFGAVASLVLDEINNARERRGAIRALARETLEDIINSYNEVKEIRRQLRAEAVRPDYSALGAYVLRKPYANLMRRLNSAQLRLESHARLIEKNPAQYSQPERLQELLRKCEAYIEGIVSEWEKQLGHFSGAPTENLLANFKKMNCFIAKADVCFGPNFSKLMGDVFSTLGRDEITGLPSNNSSKPKWIALLFSGHRRRTD